MKRVRTHIEGLDSVLGGGFPEKHVVLFVGAPGTMKSTLAYSVLHANALQGTKGLYVSLEQNRDSLLHHLGGMGFDGGPVKDNLSILDLATLRKRMGEGGSWMELFRMYTQSIRAGFPYEILVLDSLDALEVIGKFEDHRHELFELFKWIRGLGCTSLVIAELPPARATEYPEAFSRHGEDYLADGIVHVKMEKRGEFEVQRRIRVVKMRAAKHDFGYHALVYENGFRVTDVIS